MFFNFGNLRHFLITRFATISSRIPSIPRITPFWHASALPRDYPNIKNRQSVSYYEKQNFKKELGLAEVSLYFDGIRDVGGTEKMYLDLPPNYVWLSPGGDLRLQGKADDNFTFIVVNPVDRKRKMMELDEWNHLNNPSSFSENVQHLIEHNFYLSRHWSELASLHKIFQKNYYETSKEERQKAGGYLYAHSLAIVKPTNQCLYLEVKSNEKTMFYVSLLDNLNRKEKITGEKITGEKSASHQKAQSFYTRVRWKKLTPEQRADLIVRLALKTEQEQGSAGYSWDSVRLLITVVGKRINPATLARVKEKGRYVFYITAGPDETEQADQIAKYPYKDLIYSSTSPRGPKDVYLKTTYCPSPNTIKKLRNSLILYFSKTLYLPEKVPATSFPVF